MIRVTKSGAAFYGSSVDLARARWQFEHENYVRLPQFLEAGFLELVQRSVERASFAIKVHKGIGVEACMSDNVTLSLLHFPLNCPKFFRFIEQMTGCGRIGCFTGRVYRIIPGCGHYDSWHSDMIEHRMVAMSINLSARIYAGGMLQMRERETQAVVSEVSNVGLGDAIVFRLSDDLEHRITDVEGTAAKTAFAGWFKSEPDFVSILKEGLQLQ